MRSRPLARCTTWRTHLTQLWSAFNATTREWVADLRDGVKYLVAAHSFLPTGWELGLNHFAGRLAMRMPETVALLQRRWPTSYEVRAMALHACACAALRCTHPL